MASQVHAVRHALIAVSLSWTLGLGAQDSNAFRPIFVVSTGVAVPVGPLASATAAASTAYVGLALHRGRSLTSLEIGQSFTEISTTGDQHASISVTALTATRVLPLRSGLQTYLAMGVGQSWATGSAIDDRLLANASHFGVAALAGTGLRIGGRVGVTLSVQYMALVHSGTVLQVIPAQLGVNLR